MQVQKEEVRQRIINAAAEEFSEKGFQKASMRQIACKAKITPGNIYSYFSGKEALLDAVVLPIIQELKQFTLEVSKGESISELTLVQITNSLIDIFLRNHVQFMVLIHSLTGTKYENYRVYLHQIVRMRIQEDLLPKLPILNQQPLLADMLSAAILEGILLAFSSYKGDESMLREQLSQFMMIMYSGFRI